MPKEKKETSVKKEKKVKEIKDNKEEITLIEIKEELKNYINDQLNNSYIEQISKANKALIKEKNLKILAKNTLITFLLLIIVFLIYLLNNVGYFERFRSNPSKETIILTEKDEMKKDSTNNQKEEIVKKEPTLEELMKEYQYLLDKVIISENCQYLEDYYNGNLTNELKNYLALSTLDFTKLTFEDGYNIIEEKELKDAYDKIFSSEYVSLSFDYNNNIVRYINKMSSYLTLEELTKNKSNIVREITAIKVNDDEVSITTLEGIVKDSKLYNVLSLNEINNYQADKLINYEKQLNKITYIFKNEKLINIKK